MEMETTPTPLRRWLLAAAVAGSAITAILYVLIGFGTLDIGEPAPGVVRSLTTFGLMVGAAYLLITVLLLRRQRRSLWLAVAVMNAIVIWAYFATSGTRVPPFELPGLLVGGTQLVTLLAVLALAILGWGSADRDR
jgi:hypothetical protein